MTYPEIKLRRGKSDSVKRFHPWIFSGAIQSLPDNLKEGDLVSVTDENGDFLAVGFYQIGSIAVRILSFQNEEINTVFWKRKLEAALDVRRKLQLAENAQNTTYRLVHGEGDTLPGLIIDIYNDTAVMQAHAVGMHYAREIIADVLIDIYGGELKNVYYKSEGTLPYKAALNPQDGFIRGGTDVNVAIEYGLKFHIDWTKGQKTGFFIDQRENRLLLEKMAKDRKVLNMFCYTGGFSVYALRGGAQLVHSVDSSAKAIDLTRENVELNFPETDKHEAFAEDAFRYLEKMAGEYDLIILDPPAFAKHKDALRNAIKGYTRLNETAIRKIKKGGIIFTFSCSQAVNKDQFRLAVFTAAARTGRNVRILHQLHQPADHPINIYHPEGEYLKGLVIQVE
ncbi:class I SAM-dependent rRNA methyltransferase [Pseudoprevotella muciniphila]|uniref:Class I SAM-dependent rRNA methyltransferase n=1 Tax=Pseudoprevotella muciniphila TaxID=2133944 RepID=A0A5P8E532_9BACT|nr:class I SAM-dependent rRNA methyltransferase [Pseudoprevotella muciniphila]QFQ12010.1 class I SAM-dependent rRNA methyltransferase [Pseudoprevotella muciniphila]